MYQLWMHHTVISSICAIIKRTKSYYLLHPLCRGEVIECRWFISVCQLTMSLLFPHLRPKLNDCHLIIFNVCVDIFYISLVKSLKEWIIYKTAFSNILKSDMICDRPELATDRVSVLHISVDI
jgi:hypothetical protein